MDLKRAIDLAQKQTPLALSAAEAEYMVQEALAAQSRISSRKPVLGGFSWQFVPMLFCSAALLFWWLWPTAPVSEMAGQRPAFDLASRVAPPASALASRLQLPNGDEIAASPGVHFRLVEANANSRAIDLSSGDMLFSVKPLKGDQSFVVTAPGLRVRVTGTVFSVHASAAATVVRVYEGAVEVLMNGNTHNVSAGQQINSDGLRVQREPDALSSVADEFVAARAAWKSQSEETKAAPARQEVSQTRARRATDPTKGTKPVAGRKQRTEVSMPAESPMPEAELTALQPTTPEHAGEADALRQGQRLLAQGRFAEAAELGRIESLPILRGDALRAQGKHRAAVAAYQQSTSMLGTYLAARIILSELSQPLEALNLLSNSPAIGVGSPIRERALALQMQAAVQASQPSKAEKIARSYLKLFPEGGANAFANQVLAP